MGAKELPGLVLGTHGTPKKYVHALANQLEAIFFILIILMCVHQAWLRNCLSVCELYLQTYTAGWVVRNPILKNYKPLSLKRHKLFANPNSIASGLCTKSNLVSKPRDKQFLPESHSP